MRKEIVTCDVCGAEKKETNGWFCAAGFASTHSLGVYRWPHGSEAEEAKHICGESCLHKVISEWATKKD